MIEIFGLAKVILDDQADDTGTLVDLGTAAVGFGADLPRGQGGGRLGQRKGHFVTLGMADAQGQIETATRQREGRRLWRRPEYWPVIR